MPGFNHDSTEAQHLPVFCASCHRLRVSPEKYVRVSERYRREFERTASHSICLPCARRLYGMSVAEYRCLASGRPIALRAA